MDNKTILENFYQAFADHDVEKMVSFYDDNVKFYDPVFGNLEGEDVRDMWRMLTQRSKGELKVTFKNVRANVSTGTVEWEAEYTYRATGRKVINKVRSEFIFKDGKITGHTDNFDIWEWSKQALGTKGLFLGWTSSMQNKIREQARKLLSEFKNRNPVS